MSTQMTQQPYYPQQPQQGYPPQAPPQQYAQPPVQQPVAPQYPVYPQQAAPQQYAQPVQQPQGPAQPPLAEGSLDAYYSQPSAGSGPSISWTDKANQPKPIGTSYIGVVVRDVTNADVQQMTDFRTNAPLFYRDGRPKFNMKVPLKVQPSQEFPEGEATFWVKGQARDELVRAMAEAGCEGAPKAGAVIQVTLVQRRNTGAGLNPANVVQIVYSPPQPGAGATSPAPAPQAVQQQAPAQPAPAQPAPPAQQYAQQPVPQQAPVQQVAPQGQPAQAPQGLAMPADFSPEQQELMARITGGQQPVQQAG